MLMPTGLKGKDRDKYNKENAWRIAKGNPRPRINKHPGLRVAGATGAQAKKEKTEEKAHLEEKQSVSSR